MWCVGEVWFPFRQRFDMWWSGLCKTSSRWSFCPQGGESCYISFHSRWCFDPVPNYIICFEFLGRKRGIWRGRESEKSARGRGYSQDFFSKILLWSILIILAPINCRKLEELEKKAKGGDEKGVMIEATVVEIDTKKNTEGYLSLLHVSLFFFQLYRFMCLLHWRYSFWFFIFSFFFLCIFLTASSWLHGWLSCKRRHLFLIFF